MASSKDAAGSKPEREKTEASEDHGEPFKFKYVSALLSQAQMVTKVVSLVA